MARIFEQQNYDERSRSARRLLFHFGGDNKRKRSYRTATESEFKSHFPAVGTEQKQNEGGEIQGKYISLLSPGNRRNDHFSMDFYRVSGV